MIRDDHFARGAGALARAFLRSRHGLESTTPLILGMHQREQLWRFVCECGVTWSVADLDAVIEPVIERVGPPRRQCASCATWVSGHQVTPR